MSERRGERRGEQRVTIAEASDVLGISKDAVRMRIKRGTMRSEKSDEGRVYVWLNTVRDAVANDVPNAGRDELVEELRDRVRFLEGQLEQANERDRENRRIVIALTSRIPELEAPSERSEQPGASETAEEQPGRGQQPRSDAGRAQDGARRPWWRRVFGG